MVAARRMEKKRFRSRGWWWALRPLGLGSSQTWEGPKASGWRPMVALGEEKAVR